MTVCEEDSIYDIIGKYKKKYNHHSGGYTWRKDSKNVSLKNIEIKFNLQLKIPGNS